VEIGDTFKSISNRLIIEIRIFVQKPPAKALVGVELRSKDSHAHGSFGIIVYSYGYNIPS
jgi:hypothetical protein